MPQNEIIKTLQHLHEELADTQQVDEETVQMLQVVIADVRKLLDRSEPPSTEVEPIKSRLQDLLARSESDHPQLVGLLRQLTDGLANLGI